MYFVMRQEANPSARFCLPPGFGFGFGFGAKRRGEARDPHPTRREDMAEKPRQMRVFSHSPGVLTGS